MSEGGRGAGAAAAVLRPGDLLAGKYRVERVIGAGGMGAVVAAQHTVLGSRVAIKVLLPAASAIPGATERFVREARAAAALQGDHVARVVDVGQMDGGAPFLVMEYLTGSDLRRVLRERAPLPVQEVARWMLQACDAMAEAHDLGILHRDLKPGNLFLTRRPNGTEIVKVLDFGLAKVLDGAASGVSDTSLTATGLVVGSPPYMPPEQLRSLKLADARSDIWSLGVILFELLTGRQPFKADRPEGLIVAIATDEPPAPRSLRPDIPPRLEALVLWCLQKAPERRPQSVRELAASLEPFAAGGPAPALAAPLAAANAPVPVTAAMSPAPPWSSQADLTRFVPPAAAGAQMTPALAPRPLVSAPPATGAPVFAATGAPDVPSGENTTLTLGTSDVSLEAADQSTVQTRPARSNGLFWVVGGLVAAVLTVVGVLIVAFRDTAPAGSDSSARAAAASAGTAASEVTPPVAAPAGDAPALTASAALTASVSDSGRPSGAASAPEAPASAGSGAASPEPRASSNAPEPRTSSATTGTTAAGSTKSRPPAASAGKARPSELKSWP